MDEEKVLEMEKELEELRPLKDTSAKLQEEFKQKEESWLKEKADLEQAANPNWQKARKTMEAMRSALDAKGVKVDEDGNVLSNPNNVDIAEIEKKAREAARDEILGGKLEEILSEYDTDSAKLVKHFYNKLVVGEDVNLQNIDNFVRQAHLAAEGSTGNAIKKTTKAVQFSGGQGPRQPEEGALDEKTKEGLGQLMGLTFSSKKK